MTKISFLADCPGAIPTLANWFRVQWPAYYAGRTLADIMQDFFSEAKREGLPVRLLAFTGSKLVGTISLRNRAIDSLPKYHPGLGGLYVAEKYRGQGIGTELVRAGMNIAQKQGYDRVYAVTVMAGGILERLRWKALQEVSHNNEALVLYRCELEKHDLTLFW